MHSKKKSSFSYENPENSPGYLLGRASTIWHQAIKSRLDPLNINLSCFSILAAILWHEEQGNEVRQSNLIQLTKLDKMTVSKSIRSIEKTGFITRREDPCDARARVIKLTAKGRRFSKEAVRCVEEEDKIFFSTLNQKNQDLLKSVLKILIHPPA
ncbi:MAG: MarR family winged helix-turn-helix transcriptional regulator [Gammaproteobacteria bacterium]